MGPGYLGHPNFEDLDQSLIKVVYVDWANGFQFSHQKSENALHLYIINFKLRTNNKYVRCKSDF